MMSCIAQICRKIPHDEQITQRLLGKTDPRNNGQQVLVDLLRTSLDVCQKRTSEDETGKSTEILNKCDSTSTNDVTIFHKLESNPTFICGQTFAMWKATLDMTFRLRQIRKKKHVLYIQQLEEFPEFLNIFMFQNQSFIDLLCNFLRLFFLGFDIKVLQRTDISEEVYKITKRNHPISGLQQFLVNDVQKFVHKRRPRDAVCLLGITWTDLYPTEELNFVLGEGSCNLESAVMCFGHYDANVHLPDYKGKTTEIDKVDGFLLWRLFKVMSHEVCHVLGLHHCVYFSCLMNESTSLTQAMDQPFLLCPVCLRKLHKVCQFDIIQRYKGLMNFLGVIDNEFPYCGSKGAVQTMGLILSLKSCSLS